MTPKQKRNLGGAAICIVVGVATFYFRESIPRMGPIDMSQAIIAGTIAGALTGILTALGIMNKDEQ